MCELTADLMTEKELYDLTAYRRATDQVHWLREQGYRFLVSATGRPKMLRGTQPETLLHDDTDRGRTERWLGAQAKRMHKLSGVYFLFRGNRVIYVGRSRNVLKRLAAHIQNRDFDAYHYIHCSVERSKELERKYIALLQPVENLAGVRKPYMIPRIRRAL